MSMSRRSGSGYMSLRDAMNQLFEGSFVNPYAPGSGATATGGIVPAADAYEEPDNYVLCLAIPGANPDDINISAQGNTVSISGEVRKTRQGHRGQLFYQEIEAGRFSRSFTLPSDVNAQGADASYEDGILTLTLPKSEAAKTRKIQVKSAQAGGSGRGTSVPIEGTAEAGSETKLS